MKYLRVTVNGVRKLAHVAAWEAENGPVPNGCVIHHINGDKTDNRIENLELMTRSEHTRMHTLHYFQDEGNRSRQSETQRRVHNTPELVSRHSVASKKVWERPGYRERRIKAQTGLKRSDEVRAHVRAALNTPLVKSRLSEAQKRRWANMTVQEREAARIRLRAIAHARHVRIAEADAREEGR